MKGILNLVLSFFLIFVIIGFSIWKQTTEEKKEGLENMDPKEEDIIIRNNHKVKRRRKSVKVNKKISKKYRENLDVKAAFKKAGDKMKDGIMGAVNKVKNGISSVIKKLTDFIKAVKGFFAWVGAGVKCAGQKIKSLPGCMKWYLLEIIGKIFYLPFFLIFLLIRFISGINVENMIWNVIGIIDTNIYKITGAHPLYFPRDVIKTCYECDMPPFPRM